MTRGTDRAHKIPHGSLINGRLGPVLDFTILRFGLGLERDDAPDLWAAKVRKLGAYWLPTAAHSGAEQARAFAAAIEGFPVMLAALDREPTKAAAQLTIAECRSFFRTFKALRPNLKLGLYGTRFSCRDVGSFFDWIWLAGRPFPGQHFDMHQTVRHNVDHDAWVRNEDFDDFFGGEGVSVKDLEEWSGLKAAKAADVFGFIQGELLFAQGGRRPNREGPKRAGFDFAKQVAAVTLTTSPPRGLTTVAPPVRAPAPVRVGPKDPPGTPRMRGDVARPASSPL